MQNFQMLLNFISSAPFNSEASLVTYCCMLEGKNGRNLVTLVVSDYFSDATFHDIGLSLFRNLAHNRPPSPIQSYAENRLAILGDLES